MLKSVLSACALSLCSAFAYAAGGAGAGGGGGAGGAPGGAVGSHTSGTPRGAPHGGGFFDNTGVENNTLPAQRPRAGCAGAVAGVPTAGAPWPSAPQSRTNPPSMNGLAVQGAGQTNSGLPRMTQEDQRILAQIKQANDRLGAVGNSTNGATENRQPYWSANDTTTNEATRRRNADPSRPLFPPAVRDSSDAKEANDPRSVESKPDVSYMSEQSQRLALEIIRDTEKLGKVGNPGGGDARSQAQPDLLASTGSDLASGPHRPTTAAGARPGSC
jgi:hypothetical protein